MRGTARLAALAGLAALATACDALPERPDIVLVSIDSLRPDHLGSYGYPRPTSPVLDSLASEGVRFESAVSTTSWTLPAHAALFTGLYDATHGVVHNGLALADRQLTLAEVLRGAGYQTAGFISGPLLLPRFGLSQGFDVYESCMNPSPRGAGTPSGHAEVTGPTVARRAGQWLSEASDQPIFLFLHLFDVHYDYVPHPDSVEPFDPDYHGGLDATNFIDNEAIHPGMDPADLAHLVALYDGEIRFTDGVVGDVLAHLEANGRRRDAIVVVTADHGDEFFEHGLKGHRKSLYDEVVRIPLIVRLPRSREGGRVVPDQVRIVDVMPTLLSLAGLASPPTSGRDLSPLLRGEPLRSVPALAELHRNEHSYRALRTNEHKLIVHDARKSESYDLGPDPAERAPVPIDPDMARRLERTVIRARAHGEALGGPSPVAEKMSPDLREQLRALGYLDDR